MADFSNIEELVVAWEEEDLCHISGERGITTNKMQDIESFL